MTILQLNNLSLQFSGIDNPTLIDLNYEVQQGDFIILLGSNGSGKSSLLKLISRSTSHSVEKKFLQDYLLEFNPNLSGKLDCPVQQLSGGEAQAFALALCLLNPPSLLLLDEHTSALDPKTSEQIMALTQRKIQQHNMTCILTTHNLDIAMRYGNRIVFLREGKIHKMINQDEKRGITKKDSIASFY